MLKTQNMHWGIKLPKGIHDIFLKCYELLCKASTKAYSLFISVLGNTLALLSPNSKKVYQKEIPSQKWTLGALKKKRMSCH